MAHRCDVLVKVHPGREREFCEEWNKFRRHMRDRLGLDVSSGECEFVLGPYDFILELECVDADDASIVVLELRRDMAEVVVSMLTLLEGAVKIGQERREAECGRACRVLLDIRPGSEDKVIEVLTEFPGVSARSLFGPYDCTLEFDVQDVEDAMERVLSIRERLRDSIVGSMTVVGGGKKVRRWLTRQR